MGYLGRTLRMRRILFPDSQRGLIVPLDHGLTMGPIPGMQSIDDLHGWIGSSAISAVLGHKGMIERLIARNMLHSCTGVILHLNGMANLAPSPDTKIMVAGIDTALQLGADAVSIQLNFSATNFEHNLALLGRTTDAAHAAGLPILVMLYDKVKTPTVAERNLRLNHLLRVMTEMGCDAVKLALPESVADLAELIERHSRDLRIFFAGGEKTSEAALLNATRVALQHGASGLCAGRNVFQHAQPRSVLLRLAECVRHGQVLVPEPELA
jgi:class I fructose-bisphosphate aldolase